MERLTRVSLLITKATILFLPVNLMTGYFSADLNVDYSVGTYWAAFGLLLLLSCLALIGFGVMSGSMETMAIYRSAKRFVLRSYTKKHQ